MSLHGVTTQEKLDFVEQMIIAEKRMTGKRSDVLMAIAADLRARLDGRPSAAIADIEHRINITRQSKAPGGMGYSPNSLRVVGERVVQHWPAVKQALELFGAAVEEIV